MALESTNIDDVNMVDSIAADSIRMSHEGEVKKGIVLIDPLSKYRKENAAAKAARDPNQGMSWIFLLIALLFCAIGIKFKGSAGYLRALVTDMTDTRVRHNLFDDTVKETSLIVLLNAMWVICSGVMLWIGIRNHFAGLPPGSSAGVTMLQSKGIMICSGMTAAYLMVMLIAYWIVGNVFSDMRQTALWVKGAFASTGLEAFLMFPLALIALNYSSWSGGLFVIAVIVFVIGKIAFIYQGFRIFFNQISSWMLFLYYLCCLEIIPAIMTYGITLMLCTSGK